MNQSTSTSFTRAKLLDATGAMSAQQIQEQDLTSLEKVAAMTPNFNIGRASNGSGAQITLRGIGSSSTSIGI